MKAAKLTPRYVKQTAEKTKKKAFRAAFKRAAEPLGMKEKSHKYTPHLELFQKEDCPFSHAVRHRLSQLGLDYVVHNVPDQIPLKHELLKQEGGKDQIPFLVDRKTGVKLYESHAILSYLQKEYGIPTHTRVGEWMRDLNLRIQARRDEITWAIRGPYDKMRTLADEVSRNWNSLKDSYRVIREAVSKPEIEQEKLKTPSKKVA